MNRYNVSNTLPEINTPVLGYNEEWIDEELNPNGICECFLSDTEVNTWHIAQWNNY